MLRRVEATWRVSLANRHRRITHRRHRSRHRRRLARRIRQAPQDANPLRNPGAFPAETTAPSTQSEATRTAGNSAARLVRQEHLAQGDDGQEIFRCRVCEIKLKSVRAILTGYARYDLLPPSPRRNALAGSSLQLVNGANRSAF